VTGIGRKIVPLVGAAAACVVLMFCAMPAAAADCVDSDGDGYVNAVGCTVPVGKLPGDCAEGNAAVNPGATERCDDAIDSDCDGNNNNGYPNLGDDCAICDGPSCPGGSGAYCVGLDPGDQCSGFEDMGCLTASLASEGYGVVCGGDGVSETCATPFNPIQIWEAEGLGLNNGGNYDEPTCSDGVDNDCNGDIDVADTSCQEPEICDYIDNDGNGTVDDGFPTSDPDTNSCSVGVGVCERTSVWVCNEAGDGVYCDGLPGNPKTESAALGNTCDDGKDNDCDGLVDLLDLDSCAGFGDAELCGNSIDDDGDGVVDEGFPQIGLQCSDGVGACATIGNLVCNFGIDGGIGDGVVCDATGIDPPPEAVEVSCNDFIDNDCDGFTDAADTDCGAAFADLGVTCSLPYTHARPGRDCTGKHTITFDADNPSAILKADLLALDFDGTLIDIIEDVGDGDEAHLASRLDPDDWRVDSKTNKKGTRHTVFAPMPILKVTGTSGAVEDVAYCSIMPWLEVTAPDGQTISLNESSTLDVTGFLPLVDVDTLGIMLNGIDILSQIPVDPYDDFPTDGSALCTSPGECVFQIEAGCGDGGMVDVEITNLVVEGLDRDIVFYAKEGVEWPDQVNTFAFTISGLPAGGHIFYVNGQTLRLPRRLSRECLVDDLADAGTASAFGIQIDSPEDQEIVASAPVYVEGTVCGGKEIAGLRIQGNDLPVTVPTYQTCTTGDGMFSADECLVPFNEPIGQTDLQAAAQGTAIGGTFHAGSNRVVADATDVDGNRTFNTEVIFGLGNLQAPAKAATISGGTEEEGFYRAGRRAGAMIGKEIVTMQKALGDEIDPAFVIGLEESAVQDFFNEKCQDAINQFTTQASANLSGKTFATVDFKPGCSCDLNAVPIKLKDLSFPEGTTPSGCVVDFEQDQIAVRINLPDIRITVGAKKSCETEGIFGECLARTKLNVRAVSQISNIAFDFVITEDGIENQTPPDPDTQVITWIIEDHDGTDLFYGGNCNGGIRSGEFCITDSQCPLSDCGCTKVADPNNPGEFQCEKRGESQGYNPVTVNDTAVECWGAGFCNVLAGIGGIFIEVFTLGFADGFEIVGIIDFDFEFKEDFLAELDGTEPDPLELDEVKVNKETVASFDQGSFTPGDIDVEIEDGGLKIEVPASFTSLNPDPSAEETPGAVITPAVGPTIDNLVAASDEISIGLADDVFNQLFAAMREAGTLEAFCTDGDGLTVDNLLPAVADGGCDSLGAADGEVTVGDATVQGICHAIRGANCGTLTGSTQGLTNAKVGACTGFSGGDCTVLNLGAKIVCNAVPARDISFDDSVLFCARQDMEPRLLFQDDDASDHTVDTDLLLNDLNVVLAIDKGNNGYTGELEALQGCFGEEGDAAPDCLLYATCLDLTLKTTMGIDNSTCAPNQTGFVFALKPDGVIPSGVQAGVMCSAATTAADDEVIADSAESTTIDTVADSAQAFTPPFCADGLTLGGVLDFTSAGAKMFAITTDEATEGFADFLFLTGSLGPPSP
jgi:hypothetical protein